MGQDNVLRLIEKRGWISAKELSKELCINRSTIGVNLRKLININFIQKRKRKYKLTNLPYFEYNTPENVKKEETIIV